MRVSFFSRLGLLGTLAIVLSACGGGGDALAPSVPQAFYYDAQGTRYVQGESGPDASPQVCAKPRTGLNPLSNLPYVDVAGSGENEKAWIKQWLERTYLWYQELPRLDPKAYATPQAYFEAMRTRVTNADGTPKDQFHYYEDTLGYGNVAKGQGFGYGIVWQIESGGTQAQPLRIARVRMVEAGSPAAAAGVQRGMVAIAVDGVDLSTPDATKIPTLSEALWPTKAGVHTIRFALLDGQERTLNLTAQPFTVQPVQNVRVLDTPTGKVGYLFFGEHIESAVNPMIAAIKQFKDAGVNDVVVDMRYNGGGLLSVAAQLASMLTSPAQTTGKVFERLNFNDKQPFGQMVTAFPTTHAGATLPALGLQRVYVLSTARTCSASEAIINGLRGIDVQVQVIGDVTCGKPYGFIPQDNCGTTYFAIQFQGTNNKGFGDYAQGFVPACFVGDDYTRDLGDPQEALLHAALAHRATGQCPSSTAAGAPAPTIGWQILGAQGTSSRDALQAPRESAFNQNKISSQ